MPTHHCDYCLKPITTLAGVKQHISQSTACQQQWNEVLKCTAGMVVSADNDHQMDNRLDNTPGVPSDWYNESDGSNAGGDMFNIKEGPLVQQLWAVPKPEPESRHASVEDNIKVGTSPANPGRFIEQYTGIAAQIFGSRHTVFKEMGKAEYKNCRNQWSPFQSEEEWDLAHFLMKNVGQTKIKEFLKLSLVHQSGVSFSSAHTFLKHVDSL
ncbi:hypothetical protein EDC04DRAFT_2904897 [Pisolithus marmoratus]|nr:hypothetical protein EDC04DRAFT_2904897 [Pisolithus marmoratus]